MAYSKTLWKARQGTNLNRFEKEQETAKSAILRNAPTAVTEPGTPFSVENMNNIEDGIGRAHDLIAGEELARQGDVAAINGKIPIQASSANQLADKDFVNSTVSNLAAWFITPNAAGDAQWASLAALRAGPWYSGGAAKQPTQNDYAIYIDTDSSVWRASFSSGLWSPQYKVNDTPFTAAQVAAINSNITPALVSKLASPDAAPAQNSAGLVSSGGVWSWFGAALATLKTTAKTAIGAINELFDGKQNRITATGAANLLTAPASAGGQPGIKAISSFLTEASFEGNSPRYPQYVVDPNLNAFVNFSTDGGFYQVYGSNLYYGASFPPGALPEGLFLSLGPASSGAVMQLFADSRDAWIRCANIFDGGLKKDQWKKIGGGSSGGTNQFVYTLIQGQSINVAMLERGKTLALVNTHLQTSQGIQYMAAHMQVNMSGYLAVFNKGGSMYEPSIEFSVNQVSDEWYALAATSSDGNTIRVAIATFF